MSKTINPFGGAAMAVRCTVVIRGMSRPLLMLLVSSMALALGNDASLLMGTL